MATPKTFPVIPPQGLGENNGGYIAFSGAANETVIGQHKLVRIYNNSAQASVMRIGPPGTNTATTSDIALAPNAYEIFDMGANTSISVSGAGGGGVNFVIISRS